MTLRSKLFWAAALLGLVGCNTTGLKPCTVVRAEGGNYIGTLTRIDGDPAGCGLASVEFSVEKLGTTLYDQGTTIAILPQDFVNADGDPLDVNAIATGELISPDQAVDPDAKGHLTCKAPTFTAATGNGVTYQFSNVTFLSEAGFNGAQMSADLVYTDAAACTAHFKVLGLAPAVGCAADSDCHWDAVATDPNCNSITGLLSTMPAHCNTTLGVCTLENQGDFPVVGKGYSCAAFAATGNGYN